MKTAFTVERKGIYRHGVVGIADTIDQAVEIAKQALKAERDDYHEFVIEEHVPHVFSEGKPVATVGQDRNRVVAIHMEKS